MIPARFLPRVLASCALLGGPHAVPAQDAANRDAPAPPPSIIFILADDLGVGDVAACWPDGKIRTPNLDRLAAEGMRFTDAHSGSAVCTPTRYGVLTGRYAWRSRLKRGVLGGYSEHLIEPDRPTVASFLREHGFHTACFGKWHLGWDWQRLPEAPDGDAPDFGPVPVDYQAAIRNGPLAVGFDAFFGIAASLDMPPYLYIEDDRCVGVPTVTKSFKVPRRPGPAHADFEARNVLPDLARRAVEYLDARGREPERRPFFLYLPLNSPHTPIVPTERFAGKSGLNEYADFVMETDWAVGEVMRALEKNGLRDDTLVVFTSDNGCSPQADFKTLADFGHDPNAGRRGHKADIYEGGHRVPFIARWPGRVEPGSTCDATICLTDLFATAADLVGAALPADAAVDSVSLLPLLEGSNDPVRESTIHHSINGSFAIRQGKWKLCLCPGSGGWSSPRPGRAGPDAPPVQLFDLETDPDESTNLEADHPDIVARLTTHLESLVSNGRSTPGPPQANEGNTRITARPHSQDKTR